MTLPEPKQAPVEPAQFESDGSVYRVSLRPARHAAGREVLEDAVDLDAARAWADHFTAGYNTEHRHSDIRYVTPARRHAGDDVAILPARHEPLLKARDRHPARWSGATRDGSCVSPVTLNPERESIAAAYAAASTKQPLAA